MEWLRELVLFIHDMSYKDWIERNLGKFPGNPYRLNSGAGTNHVSKQVNF